eukprot:scaffold40285_cov18-Prasinocladus_malaysianus.AAC.1
MRFEPQCMCRVRACSIPAAQCHIPTTVRAGRWSDDRRLEAMSRLRRALPSMLGSGRAYWALACQDSGTPFCSIASPKTVDRASR